MFMMKLSLKLKKNLRCYVIYYYVLLISVMHIIRPQLASLLHQQCNLIQADINIKLSKSGEFKKWWVTITN